MAPKVQRPFVLCSNTLNTPLVKMQIINRLRPPCLLELPPDRLGSLGSKVCREMKRVVRDVKVIDQGPNSYRNVLTEKDRRNETG